MLLCCAYGLAAGLFGFQGIGAIFFLARDVATASDAVTFSGFLDYTNWVP